MVEDLESIIGRMLVDLGSVPAWYDSGIVRDEIDPDTTTLFYHSEGRPRAMGSLGNVRAMARVVGEVRHLAPALALWLTGQVEAQALLGIALQTLLAEFRQRCRRDSVAELKARLAMVPPDRVVGVLDCMMEDISNGQ